MFWNDPNLYSVAFKDIPNVPQPFYGTFPRYYTPFNPFEVKPNLFGAPIAPGYFQPQLPPAYFTPQVTPNYFAPPVTPFMHTPPVTPFMHTPQIPRLLDPTMTPLPTP